MTESRTSTIPINLPLPPNALSPNGNKGSWQKKSRATKSYRDTAKVLSMNAARRFGPLPGCVTIHHTWFMGLTQGDRAFRKVAAAVKQRREELAARGLDKKKLPKMPKPPFYRPLDATNACASLKAAIDGLVDSGLLAGDTHRHVKWGECKLLRTAAEHGGRSGVLIEVVYEAEEVS